MRSEARRKNRLCGVVFGRAGDDFVVLLVTRADHDDAARESYLVVRFELGGFLDPDAVNESSIARTEVLDHPGTVVLKEAGMFA